MGKKITATSKHDKIVNRKGSKLVPLITGAAVFVLIAAAVIFLLRSPEGADKAFGTVQAEAGVVRIPVAEAGDGKAHFYHYDTGERRIDFFIVRSGDGAIRAAFNACDVCYPEKKGYRQEDEFMVCNNCGRKFESNSIGDVRSGCNPAPLERRVDGNTIVITTSALEHGRGYF